MQVQKTQLQGIGQKNAIRGVRFIIKCMITQYRVALEDCQQKVTFTNKSKNAQKYSVTKVKYIQNVNIKLTSYISYGNIGLRSGTTGKTGCTIKRLQGKSEWTDKSV